LVDKTEFLYRLEISSFDLLGSSFVVTKLELNIRFIMNDDNMNPTEGAPETPATEGEEGAAPMGSDTPAAE